MTSHNNADLQYPASAELPREFTADADLGKTDAQVVGETQNHLHDVFIQTTVATPMVNAKELPPVLATLRSSFTEKYPRDSFDDFVADCSSEDITAFENLQKPGVFHDPAHADKWIVGDTVNTDFGHAFEDTKATLGSKGLELWNENLFMQEKIGGWTWLLPDQYELSEGHALYGYCRGGDAFVNGFGAGCSGPVLGGRGLRRVQRQKS